MSRLKQLFQLASTAGAIGFCFTTTAVNALQITLGNNGTICDNNIIPKAGVTCLANRDEDSKTGIIKFGFLNSFTITSGTNRWTTSGTLNQSTGNVGTVLGEGGGTLGGVRLNLTDFTVTASNTNTLIPIPTVPVITFENNFTYPFTGRKSTPTKVPASTNLGGEWRSNNLTQNVNIGDEITFASSIFTQSNEREILPSLTSRKPPAAAIRADLEPTPTSPAAKDLDNTGSRLNNPRIVGSLVTFKLARSETLFLPSSACIVVFDDQSGELNIKVNDNCQGTARVPEPSSTWSILALSALGATSWLTRKRKFLQHNKD